MPRKKPRPKARKEAAIRKERTTNGKSQRRQRLIALEQDHSPAMALAVLAAMTNRILKN